jgi:hypothetical protein
MKQRHASFLQDTKEEIFQALRPIQSGSTEPPKFKGSLENKETDAAMLQSTLFTKPG